MKDHYRTHEKLLFVLWMTGLMAFPVATLVIIGPQAPLLAGIVFFGNIWMDVLAIRRYKGS